MKDQQKNQQNQEAQKQKQSQQAGERKRDEERDDAGAQYGGGSWGVADKRGDKRFGEARNDDADPLEQSKFDPDQRLANGESESGGEREGMGRGDAPRKSADRANKNG
ncbi:MAG TPA: hypothetical protein VGM90_30350 [Kofleriaceae bacterium]|jgi:hypothetical protein